jgi:hypothetical protein
MREKRMLGDELCVNSHHPITHLVQEMLRDGNGSVSGCRANTYPIAQRLKTESYTHRALGGYWIPVGITISHV